MLPAVADSPTIETRLMGEPPVPGKMTWREKSGNHDVVENVVKINVRSERTVINIVDHRPLGPHESPPMTTPPVC